MSKNYKHLARYTKARDRKDIMDCKINVNKKLWYFENY